MSDDVWSRVRGQVLHVLEELRPDLPFEERVMIAEHAGREVVEGIGWAERAQAAMPAEGSSPTGPDHQPKGDA